MQTERVTFLTTPDHKAALDAFARDSGMSVGHVVREATTRYVAEGELGEALPHMHAALDRAIEGQQKLRADIDLMLREAGLRA